MDIEVERYVHSDRGRTENVGEGAREMLGGGKVPVDWSRVRCFPAPAHRPGAIRIKLNIKVVGVVSRADLPEDNGSIYARKRSVKMHAGDIVAGIGRLTAEIDALDVERVACGYGLRAVEDDRPFAACVEPVPGGAGGDTSWSPVRITRNTVDMKPSLAAFSICGRYRH